MIIDDLKNHPKAYFSTDNGVLLCGDCLEIMQDMPDKCIDLVLTDPPYRDGKDNRPTKDMRKNGGMNDFGEKLTIGQFNQIQRISEKQIIWGSNNFGFLPSHKGFFVWKKHIPERFTMSMAEIAYVSDNILTISKVYIKSSNSEHRYHPTQKPISLIVWCLKFVEENDSVLDPFLGSGTTAVACEKLGRKWIGIEISEKYCAIAVRRIEAEADQIKLFV